MIDPDELIRLADDLAHGSREVDWRGAISRAYYGAFHAGRLLLEALNFQTPQGSSAHAHVLLRLSNCGEPALERSGQDLRRLQSARNKADYRIEQDILQSDAHHWGGVARAIRAVVAGGLVEPTRSQITTAIRDYERNVLRTVTWQGP